MLACSKKVSIPFNAKKKKSGNSKLEKDLKKYMKRTRLKK
jgi:hypothetical protein